MKRSFLILFLIFAWNMTFSLEGTPNSAEEIVKTLQKWPNDFNSKDVQAVCGLFSQDLIASYPGVSDRNYEQMCSHLTKVLSDSKKQYRYEAPEFEQIMLHDGLAVVRLIWTLKITENNRAKTIREKGLDILKKQPDGSWKIIISYAYPLK